MSVIIKSIEPTYYLSQARRVTMTPCNHVLLRDLRNSLLVPGISMLCEACVRNEKVIESLTTDRQKKTVTMHLRCGHIRELPLADPFTYDTVIELVGTTTVCKSCSGGK